MSKYAYTPGPWEWVYVHGDGQYLSAPQRVDNHPVFDCAVLGADGADLDLYIRVREPDARLIAAAPELLEALQRLLRANEADYEHLPDMDVRTSFETNSMAVNQARAAIAKATGATP